MMWLSYVCEREGKWKGEIEWVCAYVCLRERDKVRGCVGVWKALIDASNEPNQELKHMHLHLDKKIRL